MKLFIKLILCGLFFVSHAPAQESTIQIVPPPKTDSQHQQTESLSRPRDAAETGSITIVNPQTGATTTSQVYNAQRSLTRLYTEGGYVWMSLITICLIAILFAAWKAPRWVKELGLLALILGLFYALLGVYEMSDIIGNESAVFGKDLPANILFSGMRVTLIAPMYGMIVYAISLILRIALKPRI